MKNKICLIAAAVAALAMGQASAQTYVNPDYARNYSNGYGNNYGNGYNNAYRNGYGRTQSLRCESVQSRRTYCRVGISGTVRLTRQLSRSACIRGRTWASNSRGIWVSNGCRADFAVSAHRRDGNGYARIVDENRNGYSQGGYYNDNNDRYGDRYENAYGQSYDSGQVVRCQSTSDGRTYCRNESNGNVRLGRTYGGDCAEGQTWGSDQRGIWVSGDCNASFNIEQDDDQGYYQR
jgi:hypothetical protein